MEPLEPPRDPWATELFFDGRSIVSIRNQTIHECSIDWGSGPKCTFSLNVHAAKFVNGKMYAFATESDGIEKMTFRTVIVRFDEPDSFVTLHRTPDHSQGLVRFPNGRDGTVLVAAGRAAIAVDGEENILVALRTERKILILKISGDDASVIATLAGYLDVPTSLVFEDKKIFVFLLETDHESRGSWDLVNSNRPYTTLWVLNPDGSVYRRREFVDMLTSAHVDPRGTLWYTAGKNAYNSTFADPYGRLYATDVTRIFGLENTIVIRTVDGEFYIRE